MASAAPIPPLEPRSLTASKTAASPSATADTPTSKPQMLPRSSTSQTVPRRPVRQSPTDYLSDKATTAFVRRTLCAQHLAERGRNTPAPIEELLPPLTSRNDVDLQLYALISVVLREFVQKWYTNITSDETFVAEIVQIIAHCTRALEQRLRHVDLESLLFDELPELLDTHIRAYRTAQHSTSRPPIEVNRREIYHSLCPLPALSPLPKADDARSLQAQADNEAAYRQLLVQGVLAILLPTEDLENECLTAIVGQIFSELIIGNLVAKKLSEPWMLLEIFVILTRFAKSNPQPTSSSYAKDAVGLGKTSTADIEAHSTKPIRGSYFHILFWTLIQWGFLMFNAIRLIINTFMTSRSLPPRTKVSIAPKSHVTGQNDSVKSYKPLPTSDLDLAPTGVAIADFKIWSCIANLLEVDARMPWLSGALSLIQWSATTGPGRLAGYNGVVDRLLSHHLQTGLFDPSRLPPLLLSTRAALFPNNAPGASTLVAPSTEEEMAALRRRCAKAIWACVPKGLGRLYFGSIPLWGGGSKAPSAVTLGDENDVSTTSTSSGSRDKAAQESYSASSSSSGANATANKLKGGQGNTTARFTGGGGKPKTDSPVLDARSPAAAGQSGVGHKGCGNNHSASQTSTAAVSSSDDEIVEERILDEIESGILDVFSDAYCNKHLVYGMLELILVRLMPELAEKGIIELWEERLS